MTLVTVMESIKALLEEAVAEYRAQGKERLEPIKVYAGYPPVRDRSMEMSSYVYAAVVDWTDKEADTYSACTVEIGLAIRDEAPDGCMSLYNLMEHIRQTLLRHRIVCDNTSLQLPLKGRLPEQQPTPIWLGIIRATYLVAQPETEGINFDNF